MVVNNKSRCDEIMVSLKSIINYNCLAFDTLSGDGSGSIRGGRYYYYLYSLYYREVLINIKTLAPKLGQLLCFN